MVEFTGMAIDRLRLKGPSLFAQLPDTFYAPLAQVIVAWGHFELEFENFIAGMIQATRIEAKRHWRRLPFDNQLNLFRDAMTVCFANNPGILGELERILTDAKLIQPRRNRLVHGRISVRVSSKGIELEVVGNDEITEQCSLDGILDLAYDIAHLHGRLYFISHPDPNRSYPPLSLPEKSFLQAFCSNNLPRPPTQITPSPPPESS